MNAFPVKNNRLFISALTVLFVLLSLCLHAQTTGNLRGMVADSATGEVLPFSNVLIEQLKAGASTNEHGYFYIPSLPANKKFTLTVSYIGYKTKQIPITLKPGGITDIKIFLIPESIMLQPVEKIGEKIIQKNLPDIGLQRISGKELDMLPKGVVTDVFRSLSYLPGVESTGDVSARYYVRGSPDDENLVLVNGVTVYNPFHAFGIFSIIDPDMINSVEFYKGGFTAEYGGRLSSVMNIITKDGNKNKFGIKAGTSFLTGSGLIEGPIPHGSFIITGRKSYRSSILDKFLNDKNAPIDFYDMSFKLNYANPNFIKGSKITIHGFTSGDDLSSSNPLVEDIKWYNRVFGFRWYQVTDSPLFYEFSLSSSSFSGEVIPKLSNVRPKNNTVNDLTMNMDLTYIYDSKDELHVGLEVKDLGTQLLIQNASGVTSDIGSHGTSISVYGLYKFLRYENFGLNAGSRVELIGLSQDSHSSFLLDPRVSMTYKLFAPITLKAAWGIYHQEVTTLTDESEVISLFEPWIITPKYIGPANAIHYTGGINISVLQALSLDAEGYYKILHNIPTVNDKKVYDTDPDLVSAQGNSYGMEFMLRYSVNPINFTASYSRSWTHKIVGGIEYYPRYDIRNSVSLVLEADLGKGWAATAAWIFHSGNPFTQITGYYDKYDFNDRYNYWSIYDSYEPYLILGSKNASRLPDYHRLDLSLSKKFRIWGSTVVLDMSALNVYNRANIFYFDRNTGQQVNMLPFLPTATLKIEL